MLETMINNETPTRAEISDIANAIIDGTDAIMLSAETSIGKHPLEAVNVMNEVAINTEKYIHKYDTNNNSWIKNLYTLENIEDAVSQAAFKLSENVNAKLIITPTSTGKTAINVARFRPKIPILAPTPNQSTFYRLSLVWGVIPVKIDPTLSTDEMILEVMKISKELGLTKPFDKVIITAGIPWGKPGTTNTVQVQEII